MNKLDELLDHIQDSNQLVTILRESEHSKNNCDDNKSVIVHETCFQPFQDDNKTLSKPQCTINLVQLIVQIISKKSHLVDDNVRAELANYYKRHKLKANGLISRQILESLHCGLGSQTMIWIRYEATLIHLVRELVYEPKTVANEVLRTVKCELEPTVGAKFSSVLKGCQNICREINHRYAMDEEEQEKWCEIIDWMSWFLAADEEDL